MARLLDANTLSIIQNTLPITYFNLLRMDANRWSTGLTDFTHLSETWLSNGDIMEGLDVKDSSTVETRKRKFIISGALKSNYDFALVDDLYGKPIEWYLVVSNGLLEGVTQLWTGVVEQITINSKSNLEVACVPPWGQYRYSNGKTNSMESQQRYFPNDDGFKFAAKLNTSNVKWAAK